MAPTILRAAATARALLAALGARAASLPLAAMALGLAVPHLADALFGVLPWVSAATVFTGLMAMERGGAPAADWRAAARMMPPLSLGGAALAWAAGGAIGAGAEASAWMALVAAAPVSAVAVANTLALGLPGRPAALLVLLGTLAAPATLPLVAWLFAAGTAITPADVLRRAALVVLLPALAGRRAGRRLPRRRAGLGADRAPPAPRGAPVHGADHPADLRPAALGGAGGAAAMAGRGAAC